MIFEEINSVDLAVLDFLQSTVKCAFLDSVMAFFSFIGNSGMIWILICVAMMFFRKTRMMGVMALSAVVLGFLIGELGIKNIVCRPRPFVANPDIVLNISPPSGYSFPSGHSCSSFAAATVMLCCDRRYGIKALFLAALIAFSRLYNYVHYPSDVICGILLGIFCALLTVYIFKRYGNKNLKKKA